MVISTRLRELEPCRRLQESRKIRVKGSHGQHISPSSSLFYSRIPASNKFLVVCAGSADDSFHFCPLAPSPPPPVCHALIASSGNASSAAGHTERYSLGAGFRYVVVICPHSKQCSCFVEWRLAIAHLLCAAASSACAAEQWPRC